MFRNGTHMIDTHMIDLLCFLADTEPRWVTAKIEPRFDHFDRYRGNGGRDPYAIVLIQLPRRHLWDLQRLQDRVQRRHPERHLQPRPGGVPQ